MITISYSCEEKHAGPNNLRLGLAEKLKFIKTVVRKTADKIDKNLSIWRSFANLPLHLPLEWTLIKVF